MLCSGCGGVEEGSINRTRTKPHKLKQSQNKSERMLEMRNEDVLPGILLD